MRRNILATLLVCACLSAASCTQGPQGEAQAPTNSTPAASNPAATTPAAATPAPQQQPVTASADETRLKAGGEGEAAVRLDIAPGYHVNANPPSDKFYIGTEVRAEAQEGVKPGTPVYPKGVERKLSFSDKPLSVYEGRVVIKLPLRAEKTAAQGRHTFRAKVRVQPCDDERCLPPREIDAAIPVTVS